MKVLWGSKVIAAELDCSEHQVRRLAAAGAPIRVLGRGRGRRYLADRETLLRWVRRRFPAAQ